MRQAPVQVIEKHAVVVGGHLARGEVYIIIPCEKHQIGVCQQKPRMVEVQRASEARRVGLALDLDDSEDASRDDKAVQKRVLAIGAEADLRGHAPHHPVGDHVMRQASQKLGTLSGSGSRRHTPVVLHHTTSPVPRRTTAHAFVNCMSPTLRISGRARSTTPSIRPPTKVPAQGVDQAAQR
jgi:hypothetical protein